MIDPYWWAVMEINQASCQPETLFGPYYSQEEAEECAGALRSETAAIGRRERYSVARLVTVIPDA